MDDFLCEELETFPIWANDAFPKELWGKFFKVKGQIEMSYMLRDGSTYYTLPEEVIDYLVELVKKLKDMEAKYKEQKVVNEKMELEPIPARNSQVEDLLRLKEKFTAEEIVQLSKNGII